MDRYISKFIKILVLNLFTLSLVFSSQEVKSGIIDAKAIQLQGIVLPQAIINGDTDYIQKLIALGFNVNAVDSQSLSAYVIALSTNNKKIIELMSTAMIDQAALAWKEKSKLHRAVLQCNYNLIKEIVGKDKTEIYGLNDNGETPIHLAARQYNLRMVDYLKSFGFQDVPNIKGEKPSDIINLLKQQINELNHKYIQKTIDPNYKKLSDMFINAAKNKQLNLLKKIIEKEPNIINDEQIFKSAALEATTNGDIDLFEFLFSTTKLSCDQLTPIVLILNPVAVAKNHVKIFEYLLKFESNLNRKIDFVKNKLTLLMLASEHDNTEVMNLLIKNGAEVDGKDEEGFTAFYHAIACGQFKAAKSLLDNKADIESKLKLNWTPTPLLSVCAAGKEKALEFLINENANLKAKSSDDESCLAIAIQSDHISIVKKLLDYGFDTNDIDDSNSNALGYAAYHGKNEIIQLLLDRGFDINAVSNSNYTPLIEAVDGNKIDTVKFLLKKGADIEKAGYEGTPLMLAAETNRGDIVEVLIQAGANIEAKDVDGNNAYSIAKAAKNFNICKLLTKYKKKAQVNQERAKEAKEQALPDLLINQIHVDREEAELQRKRNNSAALLQAILSGDKVLVRKLETDHYKLFGVDDTKENRKSLHDILEEKLERKPAQIQAEPKVIVKPAKAKSGHNKKQKNKSQAKPKQQHKEPKEYIQVKSEKLPKPDPISDDIYDAVLASLNRDSSVLESLAQKVKLEEKVEIKPQDIEPVYINYGNEKIKVDIAHLIQGFAGNDGLYHGLHIDFNKSLERKNKLKTVKVYPNACYDVEIIDQEILDQINKSYFSEVKKSLINSLGANSKIVLEYLASENNRKSFFPYKWNNQELIGAISEALHNIKSLAREGKDLVIIGERYPKKGEDARFSINIKIVLSIKNGEAIIKTAFPVK